MSTSICPPLPLAALREARGVSREELATACHVTEGAIYQWETRRCGMAVTSVRAVAEVLDLTDAEELGLLRWAALRDEGLDGF